MITSSFFHVRFAISGKDEEWQEALSSSKSSVNVISVTSTKRKAKVSMSSHIKVNECFC